VGSQVGLSGQNHRVKKPEADPAVGRWWRRRLAEPIEAVHNDPENAAPLPAERAQYEANARAHGIVPSPEPKVPLRARLHRFWRKRRGQTSVP
jgi:hypothetical protein